MRLTEILCSMAAASLCLWSCEKADPIKKAEPGTPYTLTKAQIELVRGVNVFAFNLLEKVSEEEKFTGKDFMVSPHSISFGAGRHQGGHHPRH